MEQQAGLRPEGQWNPWAPFSTELGARLLQRCVTLTRERVGMTPGDHHAIAPGSVSGTLTPGQIVEGDPTLFEHTPGPAELGAAVELLLQGGYLSQVAGGVVLNLAPLALVGDVIDTAQRYNNGIREELVLDHIGDALSGADSRAVVALVLSATMPVPITAFADSPRLAAEGLIEQHILEFVAKGGAADDAREVRIVEPLRDALAELLELVPPGRWEDTLAGVRPHTLEIMQMLLYRRHQMGIAEQMARRTGVDRAIHERERPGAFFTPGVEPIPDELLAQDQTLIVHNRWDVAQRAAFPIDEGAVAAVDVRVASVATLGEKLFWLAQSSRAMAHAARSNAESAMATTVKYMADAGIVGEVDLGPSLGMSGNPYNAYYLTPWGAYLARPLSTIASHVAIYRIREAQRGMFRILGTDLTVPLLEAIPGVPHKNAIKELAERIRTTASRIRPVLKKLVDGGMLQQGSDLQASTLKPRLSFRGRAIMEGGRALRDLRAGVPPWHQLYRWLATADHPTRSRVRAGVAPVLADARVVPAEQDVRLHRMLVDKPFRLALFGLAEAQRRDGDVVLDVPTLQWRPQLEAAGVSVRQRDGRWHASLPVVRVGGPSVGDLLSLVVPGTPGDPKTLDEALAAFTPELVTIIRWLGASDHVGHDQSAGMAAVADWPRPDMIGRMRAVAEAYVADGVWTMTLGSPSSERTLFRRILGFWHDRARTEIEIAEGTGLPISTVRVTLENAASAGLGRIIDFGWDIGGRSETHVPKFVFEPWVTFLRGALEPLVTSAVRARQDAVVDTFMDNLGSPIAAQTLAEVARGNIARVVTDESLMGMGLRGADGSLMTREALREVLHTLALDGMISLSPGEAGRLEVVVRPVTLAAMQYGREVYVAVNQMAREQNDVSGGALN